MTSPFAVAVLITVLVLLSASAAGHVTPAVAGPVPDAVQMALMRHAVGETPLVRVQSELGTQWGYSPMLDSSGVRLGQRLGGSRSAMRPTMGSALQIEPIEWQQISSLETDRAGSAGQSALIGGGIGLVVGLVIVLSTVEIRPFGPDQTQRSNAILGASIGGGLVLGALIGRHVERRTIYPPPSIDRR